MGMVLRKKKSRLKRLWRLGFWVIALGVVWVVYVQYQIHSHVDRGENLKADAAVVLGAALRDNVPSPALKERLNHAIKLYRGEHFKHIIVSGGLDHNGSELTEAEGMRNYLIEQGIPDSAIVMENQSRSTFENLKFSNEIAKRHDWHHLMIITHDYHGARALDMAEFFGWDDPKVSTTSSTVMFMPWHFSRETLAYTKWELQKTASLLKEKLF